MAVGCAMKPALAGGMAPDGLQGKMTSTNMAGGVETSGRRLA
jgi:hypothetical protein